MYRGGSNKRKGSAINPQYILSEANSVADPGGEGYGGRGGAQIIFTINFPIYGIGSTIYGEI